MSAIQEQINKLYTLQESFDSLANVVEEQIPTLSEKINNIKLPEIDASAIVDAIASRSVKYDKQSGNLTIENVELTIE